MTDLAQIDRDFSSPQAVISNFIRSYIELSLEIAKEDISQKAVIVLIWILEVSGSNTGSNISHHD
jgi:hypothetical protein